MNPFARRTYGTLERVTERVYLFRNIVNSVIVLGDEATAVIDTQVNAPMAERLVQQVRTLSDKPLRYAINTHYHWDHTAGNHVCKRAGATVVSSALTRTFMATSDWLETLQAIERLQPVHVLPGHGPVAHAPELLLLKRLERYFLEEIAARVAHGMS